MDKKDIIDSLEGEELEVEVSRRPEGFQVDLEVLGAETRVVTNVTHLVMGGKECKVDFEASMGTCALEKCIERYNPGQPNSLTLFLSRVSF